MSRSMPRQKNRDPIERLLQAARTGTGAVLSKEDALIVAETMNNMASAIVQGQQALAATEELFQLIMPRAEELARAASRFTREWFDEDTSDVVDLAVTFLADFIDMEEPVPELLEEPAPEPEAYECICPPSSPVDNMDIDIWIDCPAHGEEEE